MKSRTITYYLLTGFTILWTVGCTSDDASNDNGNVVNFVTATEQATTRATSRDNMWNTTDDIAITDGTTVKKYNPAAEGASVALIKASSEATPFYWAIGKGDMTFSAWAPYTATNESLTVTVASDQRATSTDAITDFGTLSDATFNAYDLLYAPPKTAASGTTVPLQFYHQMAHIIVYIIGVATEKYQDPETLEWIDLGEVEEVTHVVLGSDDAQIALSGTLTRRGVTGPTATDANKALWTVGAGTGTVTMRDADPQTETGDGGLRKRRIFECIVPPQSGGTKPIYAPKENPEDAEVIQTHGSVLMTFFTNKRNYDSFESSPYMYEDSFDYKPGYQYVYYIGLTRAGLYVDYEVQDWASVITTGARSVFNYMDHPGVIITDWTAPSSVISSNLGKFD